MATVKHPTIKGVSYDVDDADVKRWRAAGWKVPAPVASSREPDRDTKSTGMSGE